MSDGQPSSKEIQELLKKKEEWLKKIAAVDAAVTGLQLLCEHDYRDLGHSHNDNQYWCAKCGHSYWG